MCHPQGELKKAGAPAELQWSEFLHLLPVSCFSTPGLAQALAAVKYSVK